MKHPFLSLVAALALAPVSIAAVNITTTFSSGEGYVSGSIDRDDNGAQPRIWERVNAATNNSFIVGPPGVTVNPISTSSSAQAVYQTAIDFSEGAVTTFVDFTFSRSTTTPTASQTIIGMAYLNNSTSGNYSGFSSLFGVTTTGYRIVWGATDSNITDAELGLDFGNSDLLSDSLRLSMTVTRLSTAGEFMRELTLTNLTTNTVIASVTPTTATGETSVHSDSTVYTSFHSAYTTASGVTTGLNVSQFGIVQVPEPGSLILSLAGPLLFLRRRR